jgi:hypothetical protein
VDVTGRSLLINCLFAMEVVGLAASDLGGENSDPQGAVTRETVGPLEWR